MFSNYSQIYQIDVFIKINICDHDAEQFVVNKMKKKSKHKKKVISRFMNVEQEDKI